MSLLFTVSVKDTLPEGEFTTITNAGAAEWAISVALTELEERRELSTGDFVEVEGVLSLDCVPCIVRQDREEKGHALWRLVGVYSKTLTRRAENLVAKYERREGVAA